MDFSSPDFWFALGSIIFADIILSGDNAVVIALATRRLPAKQQRLAVIGGAGGAILLRVILAVVAIKLLTIPMLKIMGGLLLIYIGAKLLSDEQEDDSHDAKDNLWEAIKTILIADLAMSIDNVMAIAAAAQKGPPGSEILLLGLGLAISIPLIIYGSTLLLKIMERYPIIITLGGALLGFLAGEMIATDPIVKPELDAILPNATIIFGIIGAILVLILGKILQRRVTVAQKED